MQVQEKLLHSSSCCRPVTDRTVTPKDCLFHMTSCGVLPSEASIDWVCIAVPALHSPVPGVVTSGVDYGALAYKLHR